MRPSCASVTASSGIRVVELRGAERDAIVTAYTNTITCGWLEYLAKLPDPADQPVFRIESVPGLSVS